MYLSVKELEVRKLFFDVTYPPGEIVFDDRGEVRQGSPLVAQGSAELLANTLGEIRVRGHLSVIMEAVCDRCLELSRFPIDSDFDLFYRPPLEPSPAASEEIALSEGESEMGFYEDGGLPLEQVLEEHVLLSLPMQRVCRPDCRGICPTCGQDRNQAACACEPRPADDRWAALRDFKAQSRN